MPLAPYWLWGKKFLKQAYSLQTLADLEQDAMSCYGLIQNAKQITSALCIESMPTRMKMKQPSGICFTSWMVTDNRNY